MVRSEVTETQGSRDTAGPWIGPEASVELRFTDPSWAGCSGLVSVALCRLAPTSVVRASLQRPRLAGESIALSQLAVFAQ